MRLENIPGNNMEEEQEESFEVEEEQDYSGCIIYYDTEGEQHVELTDDN